MRATASQRVILIEGEGPGKLHGRDETKLSRMSGKEKKDVSRKLGPERSDFSQEYGKQC